MPRRGETELIIRLREDVSKLRADQQKAMAMMRKHKSELTGIGKHISTTITSAFGAYAVLGGMSKAVKSIADMEYQMSKVKAISGANEQQFKDLTNNALQLGRQTKFTAAEIGNLQEELSKLGFTPEKIIASTDAIRKLATVADAELGESAKSMAGTLNSFNLAATESDRVANIMAESFSKSALDLEKFTVATANSGAIARAFGYTLEQNTARTGALVDANIDASKAGTDLRKIYLELNKQGLTYDQAMQQIINSTDKAGTAQDLFGDRAAGAAVILAEQQDKVNKLTAELSDANMEMDTMVGIMEDNLITDWQKFNSAIDGTIQKGGALNGFLRGTVQLFTGMVNGLSGVSQDLSKFERAGIEISQTSGVTAENLRDLAIWTKKMRTEVAAATDDIRNGGRTFDALAVSTLKEEDAIAELTKRMNAYRSNPYFEEIKSEIIPDIDALNKSLEDQAKALEKIRYETSLMNQEKSRIAGVTGATGKSQYASSGIQPLQIDFKTMESDLDRMNKILEDNLKKTNEILTQNIRKLNEEINTDLMNTLSSSIADLSYVVGSGGNFKEAFGSLMGIISKGMQEIGAAMIAYGLAELAFQTSIESLNPYLAIAAGAGLIAAAGYLDSQRSGFASAHGGGGSGSSGPSGSFQGSATGQTVTIQAEFEIEGTKLKGVLKNQEMFDFRNQA